MYCGPNRELLDCIDTHGLLSPDGIGVWMVHQRLTGALQVASEAMNLPGPPPPNGQIVARIENVDVPHAVLDRPGI
jgi:hypothetical protein